MTEPVRTPEPPPRSAADEAQHRFADELPDYVERVARTYLAQREPGESFALWARRADEDDIR